MPSNNQNDYKLLYLYYLAGKEGKLKSRHKAEYKRLKVLYSIERAKQESKNNLEELGCIHIKGRLEHGEWVLTYEEKENPIEITQKGLDALDKNIFKSETTEKITEKRDKRLTRISTIIAICIGGVTLIGLFRTKIISVVLAIYKFICDLFV